MNKNAREMAEQWGCSAGTARIYCQSGIIPPAEQIKGKWSVPEDWPKPPMTRHKLCFLLDTIYQLNHGALFDDLKWGCKMEEVKAGYDYLISSAFMSHIDTSNFSKELVNATVTPRGKELIEKENAESKGKVHFKAHMTAKVNIGVASFEGGIEVSN